MTPRQILASNVKKLMAADINLQQQAKLAKAATLAQKTVSNVLNVTGPSPTLTTVQGLAKAFKCAPWRLLHPNLGIQGISPEEAVLHRKLEEAMDALRAVRPR